MTQEPKQGQTPVRAEKPAPAGKAKQPKNRTGNEVSVVELTDADLQVVTGGSVRAGGGGNFDK